MNLARSPIVRQVAPDRLEVKEGGGRLALFGVPFLAAGIIVTLIGVRIVPVENARDIPVLGWPLIVLMGLAFVAVGGGLVLGRRWIIVDAGRGTVSKQWGLLVPMRGETFSLAGYDAVVVRLQSGDSDSADRYPVLLRATGGGADLALQWRRASRRRGPLPARPGRPRSGRPGRSPLVARPHRRPVPRASPRVARRGLLQSLEG